MRATREEKWNNALKCFVVTEWLHDGDFDVTKPHIKYPATPKPGVRSLFACRRCLTFADTPEEARGLMVAHKVTQRLAGSDLPGAFEEQTMTGRWNFEKVIVDELATH
jgi:hypothetical protein